ncbi:TadE family protein [Actinopolyspora mortivallis]|uniref:TadE family protein n=1 Tax=Actinopolyspora mortivallis TaxID=33906 RepID=UPI0015E5F4BD|nr:TadE family protein [Actinopolyspora mortivallis]
MTGDLDGSPDAEPVPARCPPGSEGSEAGAVTVEAALGIGSLMAAFTLVLVGVSAVFVQLRCTDAATEAARLVARGDSERARQAVRALSPWEAELTVRRHEDHVSVVVAAAPAGGLVPELRAEARAVPEPGVDVPGGSG